MILHYVIVTESNKPRGYRPTVDLGSPEQLGHPGLVRWVKWVIRAYPLSWISA